MKASIIRDVLSIARNKLPNHPQLDCYPHYAFIIQNNKVIEWATNVSHTPPIHLGYHKKFTDSSGPKYHAELFAYKRARPLLDNDEPFEVINLRLNKAGTLKLSRPCPACYNFLSVVNCRAIHYSSEVGFLKLRAN